MVSFLLHPQAPKPSLPVPTDTQPIKKSEVEKLQEFNDRYTNIVSLEAEMDITFKNCTFSGKLSCRKPRDFHLVIQSILGEEADIGSNNSHFWYWLYRENPDTVFCGRYEHASNVNLTINPIWISGCILPRHIEADEVIRSKDFIAFVRDQNKLTFATIFDKEVTNIKGHYVYTDNSLIGFCDIHETVLIDGYSLPKRLTLSRGKLFMQWKIKTYKINSNNGKFVIPLKGKVQPVTILK